MSRIVFRLYIAGDSPRSRLAAANLRRLGDEMLGGDCDIATVDVLAEPERAEAARILTTPTLVKEHPGPARRVTGDLSDPASVMLALDLETAHPRRHD